MTKAANTKNTVSNAFEEVPADGVCIADFPDPSRSLIGLVELRALVEVARLKNHESDPSAAEPRLERFLAKSRYKFPPYMMRYINLKPE